METRANYIIIGAFMLATLIGAFGFVYWLAATAESRENLFLKIVFPAPVTGLPVGGQVLFNGIKIGDVRSLDFDPTNPKVVVATVRVKPSTPLRTDTTASLNFTGLTGVAYVDLNGGSQSAPLLLDPEADTIPVIKADRSLYDDITGGVRDALKKADSTMDTIDVFLKTNSPTVTRTLENVETFSNALASNSDGVKDFMGSIGKASDAFTSLAGRMETLVQEGERILAAVPSDKVSQIVGDMEKFSKSLGSAGDGIDQVVADAQSAAKEFEAFSKQLNSSVDQVQQIIAQIDPKDINKVVKGAASLGEVLEKRSPEIDRVIASSSQTMDNLAKVSQTVSDSSEDITAILKDGKAVVAKVNGLVAAVDSAKVAGIIDHVDTVTGSLSTQTQVISDTIASARSAVGNFESMSADLRERTPDVDQIITDAKQIASNLNAASVRVQGIVDKVGTMVEGDGEGFIAEATKAAASIRKVADAFSSRADSIASGLQKFTNQGSSDFAAAMAQVNRTLVTIQRAVEAFNRNPNRIIFGGEDVPTYNGAKRR
ncbi:MlaD family protein [Roseibium suaedae]|uniref:Phospholipid/cholesterol/gamma-HCH transport system substrate-binding protein n=1 Tax=Roseibium suaedae TaxID=735517 RepID=A0A1M7GL15_9HYPH|nr:MCE family protein [Roseibium suaedae]SHM16983.1 phospholipid/cholesterol/gamma-HCH transport system substrate-binding protein [Roseibium suaedae]